MAEVDRMGRRRRFLRTLRRSWSSNARSLVMSSESNSGSACVVAGKASWDSEELEEGEEDRYSSSSSMSPSSTGVCSSIMVFAAGRFPICKERFGGRLAGIGREELGGEDVVCITPIPRYMAVEGNQPEMALGCVCVLFCRG